MLVSEILKITSQSKSWREESKDKNGLKIQTVAYVEQSQYTYSLDRQWCPESIHTLRIESIHTLLIESIHTLLI